MDDFSSRLWRHRASQAAPQHDQQQRHRQGAGARSSRQGRQPSHAASSAPASKEHRVAVKTQPRRRGPKTKPTAFTVSVVAGLVEQWTGGQPQPSPPSQLPQEAPADAAASPALTSSSFTRRSRTTLPTTSASSTATVAAADLFADSPLGGSHAPVSPELPPLLLHTIGLAAPAVSSDATAASAPSVTARPFSCVVIDLETTGFSAARDEILEVGCVELRWTPLPTLTSLSSAPCFLDHPVARDGLWVRGGRVFHRYVRPSSPRRISAASTAVHGITWQAVEHCASWPEVARELVAYLAAIRAGDDPVVAAAAYRGGSEHLGGCTQPPPSCVVHLPPIIAHNAAFDSRFLDQHLRRCGYTLQWHPQYPLTCTRRWGQKAYPHVPNNLDALAGFHDVAGAAQRAANCHGALGDASLTALLFLRLCQRWKERFGDGACA